MGLLRHTSITASDSSNFSLTMIRNMAEPERSHFIIAFADSLAAVFFYAVPPAIFAFVLTWFLRSVPLRTTLHSHEPATDRAIEPDVSSSTLH